MDAKQYAKIGLYPIKSIKEDFYPLLTKTQASAAREISDRREKETQERFPIYNH